MSITDHQQPRGDPPEVDPIASFLPAPRRGEEGREGLEWQTEGAANGMESDRRVAEQ